MRAAIPGRVMALAAMTCVSGNIHAGANEMLRDYSGSYFTVVGHEPRFTLQIRQFGASVEFSLAGKGIAIEGNGTVADSTMTLGADLGGDVLSMVLTFSQTGTGFQGSWEVVASSRSSGTISGTTAPWPTYDLASLGIPRLAVADCTDLGKIQQVSRFRSGEGHDYSDDFEGCRSMKHYYMAKEGVERTSVRLFSPVSGTVLGTTDEWDGSLWKGTVIGIRPDGYAAFNVAIFHVDLQPRLVPGDRVVAGQLLGTSEKITGTVADLAVGVRTPAGYRLISLFEVMTDDVFDHYARRGIETRSAFIISRQARDADPLVCVGEQFVDRGTLENWVVLEDDLRPYRARRHLRHPPR